MDTTLFKNSKLHLTLVAALGVTLAACGGGGSGGATPAPGVLGTALSGVAVDGPLTGATACVDKNSNGVCDIGETTTAVTHGLFSFLAGQGAGLYPVVVYCTPAALTANTCTDDTTGAPFNGTLKTPAGAKVASPLTTLMADGVSLAQIALMFPALAGLDPLNVDPTTNNSLMAAGTAMQQLVDMISLQILAGGGTANLNSIMANLATALAANPIDMTTGGSALIAGVMQTSATGMPAGFNFAGAAASIAASVQQIANAKDAASLAGFATTASNTTFSSTGGISNLTNIVPEAGVSVNGTQATLNASGVLAVATAVGAGVQNATINFGTVAGNITITNPITVAVDVTSTTPGDNRTLQAAISGLTLTNTAGVLSVTATQGVTTGVGYGQNTAGTLQASISASNVTTINSWFSSVPAVAGTNAGGGIQLNATAFINSLVSKYPTFANVMNAKGNFNVKMVVSGVSSIANSTSSGLLPQGTITVPGITTTVVTGQTDTVNVTVN